MTTTEAAWTPANDWQPHPEWWHAPDGNATETEVTELVAALVRALQPELVVEVGTYQAHTTRAIGAALAANGHGHLETIEYDTGLAHAAIAACARLPVTVRLTTAIEYTPPGPVGLLFLDSGSGRDREMARLAPHMAPGGIVAVHDTAPHHLDDGGYLGRLARDWPLLNLRTPRGVALLQAP